MLKKILKFFLWLLLIALVCAGVIGYYLWKDKPLQDALLVLAGIAVFVVLFLVIRRIIVRWRAKRQVRKLINEEHAEQEASEGEHLRPGATAAHVDGRGHHHQDEDDVDPVHRRRG